MLDLQEISDRLEIQEALVRYCDAVDRHDWDLLDRVFLPNADIDYREVVPYHGDLVYTKRWLSKMTTAGTYYHMLGPGTLILDGDVAHTRTPCYNPMPGSGQPVLVGHWYVDDWVRTEQGWLINKRVYRHCYRYRVEPVSPPT